MDDSLNKLYNTLTSKGLYTKSLNDFKNQYKDEEYRKKVFDVKVLYNLFKLSSILFN